MKPSRNKILYVAGPYRAATEYEVVQNIRNAEAIAIKYWKAGFTVICPHKNTALLGGACPDAAWLEGDIEILRRCDGIVMAPGWEKSSGAILEREEALRLGIPVIYDLNQE